MMIGLQRCEISASSSGNIHHDKDDVKSTTPQYPPPQSTSRKTASKTTMSCDIRVSCNSNNATTSTTDGSGNNHHDGVIPVFPRTILGRRSRHSDNNYHHCDDASTTTTTTQVFQKLDLGIDAQITPSAHGISREQLYVLHVSPPLPQRDRENYHHHHNDHDDDCSRKNKKKKKKRCYHRQHGDRRSQDGSITIVQPSSAVNPVGISKYSPSCNAMTMIQALLEYDKPIPLMIGDMIFFDLYMKQHPGVNPKIIPRSRPRHVFQVVPIEVAAPSSTENTADSAAIVVVSNEDPYEYRKWKQEEEDEEEPRDDDEQDQSRQQLHGTKHQNHHYVEQTIRSVVSVHNKQHKNSLPSTDVTHSTGTYQPACAAATVADKKVVDNHEKLYQNPRLLAVHNHPSKPCDPKPGDRVRVWFDDCCDAFGQRWEARGWYFGTIHKFYKRTKVTRSSYKNMDIDFDDGKFHSFKYPANDVQLLCRDITSQSVEHEFYYASVGTLQHPQWLLAYDPNPDRLDVGDLVTCLYQQGRENGKRFRGRVALIDRERRTVDVAYDDNEYETNVPMGSGFIHLLRRGEEDPFWMHGLTVTLNVGETTRNGIILQAYTAASTPTRNTSSKASRLPPREKLEMVIKLDDKSLQTFPYTDIASLLMMLARDKAERVLEWPKETHYPRTRAMCFGSTTNRKRKKA